MSPPTPSRVLNRRHFLRRGAGAVIAAVVAGHLRAEAAPTAPSARPIGAFDDAMLGFMRERNVPGGALAVVKDRRLVYARGYGWANREKQIPVRADSLFRLASVSKPITAVAVLKLVEEGRLRLTARAFDLVKLEPLLPPGTKPDQRLRKITLLQLLQHTGGWDRDKSYDPMFRPGEIARAADEPPPAGPAAVIRYMLGQPLDFDPGARYAYSNLGYCVLGRVIEAVTGRRYEEFVRDAILAPLGVTRMRIGASLDGQQAAGEVRYYTAKEALANNVFPGEPKKVPWPYGGFHLEAMDAHGGWIASAVDVARFVAALDDPQHSPLLKPETHRTMLARPALPAWQPKDGPRAEHYYGCGWSVRPVGGQGWMNFWHTGSLPGTATLLVRRADGVSFAALFNQRSEDRTKSDSAIDPALNRAVDSVPDWPKDDLFATPDALR